MSFLMIKCIYGSTPAFQPSETPHHLSLPADSLNEAQRIARVRKVNVSTVIGEALLEGLRLQTTAERSNEVLERYKTAFSGFSDSEMAILNGIILQPTTRK